MSSKKQTLSATHIPLTPINDARYQAMFTTYPTRMRLGTTSLMQPGYAGVTALQAATNAKRLRTAVNYAEMESGGADESDEDSMESDSMRQQRKKYSSLGTTMQKKQFESAGQGQHDHVIEDANIGDGKSYLGVAPPANLIQVQRAITTRHVYS